MTSPILADIEYQSIYRSELAWAGISELPPRQSSDRHAHSHWEFIYIDGGCGRIVVGQDRYSAHAGDVFIYPPHIEHIEYADEGAPLTMKVLCIINNSDMDFMNFWPLGDKAYVQISNSWLCGAFDRIMVRILEELAQMETAYIVRIKSLGFEFLSYLVKYAQQATDPAAVNSRQAQVIKSKHFIEEHYAQNIKLTDIAAESYVSMYYLSHLFKEHTGYSPMNYLAAFRINKAQDLLDYSEYSITEISQIVGYEDLQHFSNAFKKRTGMSPRAYRNRQRDAEPGDPSDANPQ